ncbi:MAG: hypothetical protein RLZZ108_311, partial [Actinomycetota bacterium]
MKTKITEGWARISLRSKLTALSVALIGVLLMVSSAGTLSVVKTYLQQNSDSIIVDTARVLAAEDPVLVQAKLASRQLALPRLPSDFYISYLDSNGTELFHIISAANGNVR